MTSLTDCIQIHHFAFPLILHSHSCVCPSSCTTLPFQQQKTSTNVSQIPFHSIPLILSLPSLSLPPFPLPFSPNTSKIPCTAFFPLSQPKTLQKPSKSPNFQIPLTFPKTDLIHSLFRFLCVAFDSSLLHPRPSPPPSVYPSINILTITPHHTTPRSINSFSHIPPP